MKRILFCNVAYMQYYDISSVKETPKYGGKYVRDTGDAYEKHNFYRCADGKVRGFVETKYVDGSASAKQPKQIRIENIDPVCKNADFIDNVMVVFCAHSDERRQTVIVGWYTDATVYRNRSSYNGRQYNLECRAKNAHLLVNEKSRSFKVPRASQDGIGFGQSNVWYAKDNRANDYVRSVIEYIEHTSDCTRSEMETIPQEVSEEFRESGVARKVWVNKYERNSAARTRCIDEKGSRCIICGFDAGEIYGKDFNGKIEVHHIVPICEIQQDYTVDPIHDLIPVCPNCHTILHTKMHNGSYPTIEELKTIFLKKN